jgi:hypothetical protein
MGVAASTKVQLYELPALPSGLLGTITGLLGARAEAAIELTDLPGVRDIVKSIPGSILVAPEAAQARLPYDIGWP